MTQNDFHQTEPVPRLAEKTVTLYGQQYRAVVVHSSAHDKRRHKRIDDMKKSEDTVRKLLAQETEHTLRQYVNVHGAELPGWDNKKTRRPTAFMMSIMFSGLQVIRVGASCRLSMPLTDAQRRYLKALGLEQQHIVAPSQQLSLTLNKSSP